MSAVDDALREEWLELRNGFSTRIGAARACVEFAGRVGLLNAQEVELWTLRLEKCPGHDDEGGRAWCAYCGEMEGT